MGLTASKRSGEARIVYWQPITLLGRIDVWGKREAFELARAHLAPDVEVTDIDLPDLKPERVGTFDLGVFIISGILSLASNDSLD